MVPRVTGGGSHDVLRCSAFTVWEERKESRPLSLAIATRLRRGGWALVVSGSKGSGQSEIFRATWVMAG